jgi:F420-non-reducing hydrogenase iron-sulfur subunit
MLTPILEGADDALMGHCHPGDCNYLNGNDQVQRRVDTRKEILKGTGMDENRVSLRWIATSEVENLKRDEA